MNSREEHGMRTSIGHNQAVLAAEQKVKSRTLRFSGGAQAGAIRYITNKPKLDMPAGRTATSQFGARRLRGRRL
jgi:hypothetical protein